MKPQKRKKQRLPPFGSRRCHALMQWYRAASEHSKTMPALRHIPKRAGAAIEMIGIKWPKNCPVWPGWTGANREGKCPDPPDHR